MSTVREGLERLRAAAADGSLRDWCRRRGVDLLVVHGSAVTEEPAPADLDVAVRLVEYRPGDVLPLVDDLVRLTGTEAVDLMVLNRAGCVAREQALIHGEPVVELAPGAFAREQVRATMERLDTDWLRRLDLALMADG